MSEKSLARMETMGDSDASRTAGTAPSDSQPSPTPNQVSPLPWKVSPTELISKRADNGTTYQVVIDGEWGFVADCGAAQRSQQNAAHIVQCVNQYPALLQQRNELLQALRAFLEKWPDAEKAINAQCVIGSVHGVPYNGPSLTAELAGMRAVIAQVEGQ